MTKISPSSSGAAVSVIIPLYNKAKHINRAIKSVLAQTYQNFEIVVVNDGSTDRSPAIVAGYGDRRIRLIHQVNAGPGAARNRGIQESTAPLLSFLDADDEWMPNFLEVLMQHLHQHPECQLAVAGHYRAADQVSWEPVFRQGGVTEGVWQMPLDIKTSHIKPALDFFHSGSVLARRSAIERLGGFYEKHRCTYGEDIYLWLQVALNYKTYRHPSALMWYHTEASEIGTGRQTPYPPHPMLLDPEPIWRNCPPQYHPLLRRCLGFYAILAAQRCLRAGNRDTALSLLRQYPQTRTFIKDYIKLRLSSWLINVPQLYSFLQQARNLVQSSN